jgi:hypothetical protein
MKKFSILSYLLIACTLAAYLLFLIGSNEIHIPSQLKTPFICSLFGSLGGLAYCLRGFYLNNSVHKSWDDAWISWYFVRPVVSSIFGGISFLFISAGLIFLDAKQSSSSNHLGVYSLSFLAGLNVDRFLKRIEEIGSSVWGIEQSRQTSKETSK